MSQPAVTVVGLGPGDPGLLTLEASRLLESGRVILRTRVHPTIDALSPARHWGSFDALYEQATDFNQLYEQIVRELIRRAMREPIIYAVPGHPLCGEATVRKLLRDAPKAGLRVRVVPAVSFIDAVASLLALDPVESGWQIVDALELVACLEREPFAGGAFPLSPTRPALVAQVHSHRVASLTKLALMRLYPDTTPVTVIHAAGGSNEVRLTVPLHELDHDRVDHLTTLYLPASDPLASTRSADGVQQIVARLRAPSGCPWDREQSHVSLARHLLEETHEAIAAIEAAEPAEICDELGDVLLQVLLHAQIAEEAGDFVLEDIYDNLGSKLVRRHPHVFGAATAANPGEVIQVWDQIKRSERASRQGEADDDPFHGIPRSLPALARAQNVIRRAEKRLKSRGLPEDDSNDVLTLNAGLTRQEREASNEFVRLVRYCENNGLDAEQVLRRWTQRYERHILERFDYDV